MVIVIFCNSMEWMQYCLWGPSLLTTLRMEAPVPSNGHVIERSWWRDMHCILHVMNERYPSQLVQISIWQNIVRISQCHT